MKHLYKLVALCIIVAFSANAQQLPNVGFESDWVDCYPWNSIYDQLSVKDAAAAMGSELEGLQPEGWTVSHVLGVVSERNGGYGALGTTEVAKKVAGYNSNCAIKLINNPNPFMATQIVPAYMTLGKSWATNTLNFMTYSPENKDGGSFGGLEFSYRPDALVFDYTRECNEAQNGTVLVYSWKGTWIQENVPGNNAMGPVTVPVTMVDRDRNILGIATLQGGEVTKTDDAELISKTIMPIEGTTSEWKQFVAPISYLSDADPEKINVVIASNDYFDGDKVINGNSLTVDNVRFVYYSRLSAITVGTKEITGFDSQKYDYTVPGSVPAAEDIKASLLGEGKSAVVHVDIEGNTARVTVLNSYGEDIDGENSHVYTLSFVADQPEAKTYNGFLNIEMMGSPLAVDQAAAIIITPTGEGLCTFALPNFSLGEGEGAMYIGDVVIPNVVVYEENGVSHYDGSIKGLQLEGGIVADAAVKGTISASGDVNMNIDVVWMGTPIKVTFTSNKTTGIEAVEIDNNVPADYYDLRGVKVTNPENGIFIRRQGNKVTKVIIR